MSDALAQRSAQNPGNPAYLQISLREIGVVVERMLQVIGVAPGLRPSLHDAVVAAQIAGLNGLGVLTSDASRLVHPFRSTSLRTAPATFDLCVDCHGQSLLVVAAQLLDHCRERLGQAETVRMLAVGVDDVSMLAALGALAGRCGVRFRALAGIDSSGLVITPASGASAHTVATIEGLAPGSAVLVACGGSGQDVSPSLAPSDRQAAEDGEPEPGQDRALLSGGPEYARATRHGVRVPADQWWAVWEHAKLALAEESAVSMRHAGPVIVDATGTVHGEPFEDL
jgi:hypothetical protein